LVASRCQKHLLSPAWSRSATAPDCRQVAATRTRPLAPPGGIDLIPIIETARGLDRPRAIRATGTRVRRLAFSAGDSTLDINMARSRDAAELAHAPAAIVPAAHGCSAAEIASLHKRGMVR
jgi:citrate lyase beta subunit